MDKELTNLLSFKYKNTKKTNCVLLKDSNNLTKKDKARFNELMEYYHIDTIQAKV